MRTTLAILAMGLMLCACGQRQAANQANAAAPTVQQLDAQAAQAEAEAARLEAQASGAPAAPAAAPAPGGMALAAGDEKLKTGQYYDTIGFDAHAGQTFNVVYDAHGYQPVIIVLGPDNKPDSQSQGPTPDPATGQAHVENETKVDRTGTWHVLLSSLQPGATGAYTVRVDSVTQAN